MLQDIRKNSQGTIAKIIVGLIVVAFAGFGVESILLGGGGSGAASVNGEDISPQELQQAVNNQKRRLISMLGDNIDPAMLDDDRLTPQAMESLIQRKLLRQSAESLGLDISDSQVGAVVANMEQFQVDGQFSPELYRGTLSSAGFTPLSFKQTLQEDMVIGQARSGLSGSEFTTSAELDLNARIAGEQRDLRYLTIPLENFSAQVEISEQDIAAYYENNSSDFLSPEAVELDFIELLADDYRQPVEEQLLRDAYQQEIQDNQYQTENRVSHILFETGADADETALQQRIANAQAKLAEGVPFADVATEFSDDIGSAGFGGDLGYSAGDAFPEEMEQAIAALDVDQVSEPVETEAGVHIILLTERREGEPPAFEEMRAKLEDSLQLAEARVELLRTVESLKDVAFNAEDLAEPAESLSLEVSSSEKVQRNQAEGLFASPQLLAAAFSEDVLEAGHNSEVIELNRDHWVVLRVRKHHESQVMPLEQVSGQIVARLTDQRARDAVTAAAEAAVVALRSGSSVENFANDSGYAWQVELGADRRNLAVPREVLQGAFSLAAPEEGESTVDYVLAASGDALVYELDRVSPGNLQVLPAADQQSLQQQVGAEYAQVIDAEYQQGLRDSAEINVM
jgi:peptidyl-prolyl cis-trans isomerase D